MNHRLPRYHVAFYKLRTLFSEELIALLLVLFIIAVPAGATTRFENRGLFMQSVVPGATTSYKLSLDYMTPEPVGSLDMRFCVSPIPYDPCVTPPGLDISDAVLSSQTGEIGFSISNITENRMIISRAPAMISGVSSKSTYTLDGIKNPTDISKSFSIRLSSHTATDASGPLIDFGSVKGQVGEGINIETQVPPMLIFCVAQKVEQDCSSTNETYYTDMGNLDDNSTLTASSQMAVGTNATAGFAITVSGEPLAAGVNVIDGIDNPANSTPGTNQFGINLVENSELNIGNNPEGPWANAIPSTDYGQPNVYKYIPGDVVAFSPNVSLMKKFTVSYIVNASPNLRAGVYTTTINYIASGRF